MSAAAQIETGHEFSFKAFLSYSHAADGKLAPALQSALHRFAKPWYQLRALRVFRDKTSLSANPALWPSIVEALSASEYFLLLASPAAAASQWVQAEVKWWVENRSTERLLILLTDGDLVWDAANRDFDWHTTVSLPSSLRGRFHDEPLWVDFRWAKSGESLSLRHVQFRAAVLDLAAPLHGRPKDQLDGEDVRQHRRVRLLSWTTSIVLLILLVVSILATRRAVNEARIADEQRQEAQRQRIVAEERREEAEHERDIALGRQLSAQAALVHVEHPEQYQRRALLLIEAAHRSPPFENDDKLRALLLSVPVFQVKHDKPVDAVAFNPDGRHFATVSRDGSMRVFDATNRWEPVWTVQGARVWRLSFSPDGGLLAGASGELALVWDVGSGRELFRVPHDAFVNAISFSPDGRLLATASKDKTARVLEARTGKEISRLFHPAGSVALVVFSPDGTFVASASDDKTARVFEAITGKQVWIFEHFGPVTAVAFSPDGKLLATASEDGSARVFDTTSGKHLQRLVHESQVRAVAFSPNGSLLATGSLDRTARLFSPESGIQRRRLSHPDVIEMVAFSPDGRYLATDSSNEKALRLWEVAGGVEIVRLAHPDFIFGFAFSPDGKYVATACQDGSARVFQTEQSVENTRLPHPARVYEVAFSRDGQLVATGSLDGTTRVFQRESGREIRQAVHPNAAAAVAFSEDGRFVAKGNGDGGARVINIASGKEVELEGNRFAVHQVAFSPDGMLVATAGQDGKARVFDIVSGLLSAEFDFGETVETVAFSKDGQFLLAGTFKGVFPRDLREKTVAAPPLAGGGFPVQFSPDGRWIALSGKRGIVVVDSQSWQQTGQIDQPFPPSRLAFSPDGRFLATQYGKTVEILDFTARTSVGRIVLRDEVHGISFSRDARALYTATGSPLVLIEEHLLRTADLVSELCGRLGLNLSFEEWKRYVGAAPYRSTCEVRH